MKSVNVDDVLKILHKYGKYTFVTDEKRYSSMVDEIANLKALKQEPKTGHWCRKTKVDAYDIAGVKTWGIKCQCDRCDFATIVVEDFGYYKYCPNCGAKMVKPQERSEEC
jgi:hypothetical protein